MAVTDPAALDALAGFPAERLSGDELERLVDAGEIEAVIVATPDIQGKLFGKSMPARLFLAGGGVKLSCGPLTFDNDWNVFAGGFPDIGKANGWVDMDMHPDMRSLRRLASLDRTAIVIADGTWLEGEPVEQLPRRILARQLERVAARGLAIVCAVEAEFYVFAEDYASARAKSYAGLERVGDVSTDHSIQRLGMVDPLVADIRQTCIASGIPIETIKHEWGRVQLELSLTYCDAMEAADRITLFKLITKQVAARHDLVATFMARYSHQEGPSSGHVHVSVWDPERRQTLMTDDLDDTALSRLGRHWLGGQMTLVRELMPLFCPNVNSYKRLRLDACSVGPVTNAWSLDVRTVPFRVMGAGPALHIEHRIPGADANFYLALAGMIASGLYGIEHELEPVGEPLTDGSRAPGEDLPRTLPAALELFQHSERARELLGDKVVDHLVTVARNEVEVFDREVTNVERRRLFEWS